MIESIKYLYQEINTQKEGLRNFNPEVFDIPKYITENLKYSFFDWQKDSFENFLFYNNPKSKLLTTPTHLMFNMATGTGKTLLMASTILYYYNAGYRHFIFFVNQNNIIDKTENNFVDNTHIKYLFTQKIVIDDKTIEIKKVDTFSDSPQGIEIKFTSMSKLHNDVHTQKENQTTLDDLNTKDIVMLADEAHHLNTDTKKKKGEQEVLDLTIELTGRTSEKEIEKSWEHTVIELILNKNNKKGVKDENKNVLLEFTATIPETQEVAKKYENKIISKFGLKEFLQAGYTKEINLVSSSFGKKDRIMQALLFQWYRHKIALKYEIANFKPVVLFRSKTIEESKTDYQEFLGWVDSVSADDFRFLKDIKQAIVDGNNPNEQGKSRTEKVIAYIAREKLNFGDIANWIKYSYQEKNVIITNSKTLTIKDKKVDEIEKQLNNLEDKNNNIRAIFTVDRLTEGWDVLNLFDIVRLYEGQNTGGTNQKTGKTPESTTKEKQLIGRGVRYYPFEYTDKIKNKRKFDDDTDNELRILEELFYYTFDEESRYISHLKNELKKDGYIADNRTTKTFDLKAGFRESNFYKNTKIWYNKQVDNPNRKKKTLEDIQKTFSFVYQVKKPKLSEQIVQFELNNQDKEQKLNIPTKKVRTETIKFSQIEKHIVNKAINIKAKQDKSLFRFSQLKTELDIGSIDQLQNVILKDFELSVVLGEGLKFQDIDNSQQLDIVIKCLDKIFLELKNNIHPKIGSEFIAGSFDKFFKEPKTKIIETNNQDDKISTDNQWYALDGFVGTNMEKSLVELIKTRVGNIEEKYDSEFYLLRNEEVYKIYDYEQGRGFMPDFILLLKEKDTNTQYQIFIEPKGGHIEDNDRWKEDFLVEISRKHGLDTVIKAENKDYKLIGLPFFTKDNNSVFDNRFKELLG